MHVSLFNAFLEQVISICVSFYCDKIGIVSMTTAVTMSPLSLSLYSGDMLFQLSGGNYMILLINS